MTTGSGLALVYSSLVAGIVWTALVPRLLVRLATRRASVHELYERLGRTPDDPSSCTSRRTRGTRVLVHAVSAGEMNAARPLVAQFGAHGCRVLLTTGTRAGAQLAEGIAADQPHVERCAYLPWDRYAVRRWLRALRPDAAVVIETEIWPNLFLGCREVGIPLFLASGRIRAQDVPRYRLARRFFRQVLDCPEWIGVQSGRERDAFVAIGASPGRVEIAGNLKFDAAAATPQAPTLLTSTPASRPLLVAGSTHHPEERWLLDCVGALALEGRGIRIVLAPRDVGRAGQVAALARRRGLHVVLWSTLRIPAADTSSADGPDDSWDVLVLDEHGGLASLYSAADIVFVGGTLARVGGHNILEPAAAARPILVGPHVADIEPLVQQFETHGGIIRLSDLDPGTSLVAACRGLLDDPDRARRTGLAAREICRTGTGSAERYCQAILERLRPRATVHVPERAAAGMHATAS